MRVSAAATSGALAGNLRDELQTVSPIFARQSQQKDKPTDQEWQTFAQNLRREMQVHRAPASQALRDRLSASNNRFLRWLSSLP